jgi:hypothetical protein
MSKFHLGHENKVLNNALMDDQRGVVDGAGDDGVRYMDGCRGYQCLAVLTQ